MGIYDKKQSIPRRELREVFRKDTGQIPHTGGKKFYERERKRLVDETIAGKYGSEISKQDYRGALRDLSSAKSRTKTFQARRELEKRISYLKRMGGMK